MSAAEWAIRPAVPEDAEAIRDLVERAYRGDSARQGWTHEADMIASDRTSREEIAETIADPGKLMLIALNGERMFGTVTIAQVSPDRCYLGMLAVDPQAQAGGLGKRLVTAAEAAAAERFAATAMEMTVIAARQELIAWYERRGYVRTGEQRELAPPDTPPLTMDVLLRTL